jgi:cell wall-associated NlpC family hydrolase
VAVDGLPRRVAIARSLIGRSYRYGGETPAGFDCSGFVLYVFERDGVRLPRSASEQALAGRWVPLDELGAGDLVFFSEVGNKPHHVGVVVSAAGEPLRMIHASTSQGVVETEIFASSYWLRRLRFGRRIDGAAGGPG